MSTDFRSLPGVVTGNTLTTRNIFASLSPSQIQWLPSMLQIDGSLSRDTGASPVDLLRAGLLMGKITTGGKYRPTSVGVLNGAITSSTYTSLTVAAAVATEVARLIAVAAGNVSMQLFGPPTAAGTNAATAFTATAASGTTITITSVSLPAYVDKSLIQLVDGSQTPVTVISDAAGIDVMDTSSTSINQFLSRFLRGADLIASQIVVGNAAMTDLDTSLQTWIKQTLNGAATPTSASPTRGNFTFDNDR